MRGIEESKNMIKSIKIKDSLGTLIYKINVTKNGEYEQILLSNFKHWTINVRDEKGKKVII